MKKMNEQQMFLERVKKINHMPTFVCLEVKDIKTGKYRPGKRYNIGKYQLVDHRTVGSNEIIWELDFSGYATNYEIAIKIIESLENRGWKYCIAPSGGKGIHISMWFNKIKFEDNDKLKKLFTLAISYGLNYKKIRFWIWQLILEETGLWDTNICKDGGKIDRQPMNFIEEEGKYHTIRVCGGRKIIVNKNLNSEITFYKSYVTKEEFTKRKNNITNIIKVKYPKELICVDLDESEFAEFLNKYIKYSQNIKIIKREDIKLKGSYVELQSVQNLLQGTTEGQRAMGARVIAIACKLDGFNENKAETLMVQYVNNCGQLGSEFTLEEANRWVEWVYIQPEHFWNCELVKILKVHDDDQCEYCRQSKKDILKVLEGKNLLKRIDNFLSITIVGEKKNRILTFFLLLSSKFHVNPEWNLKIGDPKPASLIFSSLSSSGKSWLTKQLLPLFGKKGLNYHIYSRMTKQALNYFSGVDMNGVILFVEELQGMDAESNQLRLWISEGQLNLATIEKDADDKNVLVTKQTIGQPMFVTGTAEDTIDEQMSTRSWLLSLDISEKQTKKILDFEDKIARGEVFYDEEELRILQDSLKELRSFHFIIPYYDYKMMKVPTKDVRVRRDYSKFRYMICCSALLHQKQRITFKDDKEREFLVCNFDDYEIAKEYSEEALRATFSGLTNQQIELANQIKTQNWADEFEGEDVQRLTDWSQSKVYTILKQLEEVGVITSGGRGVGGGRGITITYAYNHKKILTDLNFPTKEELMVNFEKKNSKLFSILTGKSVLLSRNDECSLHDNKNEKMPISQNSLYADLFLKSPNKLFSNTISELEAAKNDTYICKNENEKNMYVSKSTENKIVYLTPKDVVDYIKNSDKHMIPISEFKDERIDEIITNLKKDGVIFEPKPGMVMLL